MLKQHSFYIEGAYWAYKSKADLAKEIGISESSVRRALGQLLRLELIQVKQLSTDKYDHINFISLNADKLFTLLALKPEPINCRVLLKHKLIYSPSEITLPHESKNPQGAQNYSHLPLIHRTTLPPCPTLLKSVVFFVVSLIL
jgi:hypothetical protein